MFGFLKRPIVWIILGVIVLGGGAFFLFQSQGAARKAEVEAAASAPVESPYAAIANGKADVEGGVIQVAARRGGVIREVYVQEGDRVVAGQILARQEDDEPRLAVERARAEVNQQRAQLRLMNVELSTARREYERLLGLVDSNFVAAQRLDQARDSIAQVEARIAAQNAAIATATARLNEAEFNLELTVIRAPMDGRIARRYANPGSGASTLQVSTLFDLEPDTQRIVRAEIVEADIANVRIGQEVEISPEGRPDQIHVGRVLRIANVFGARRLQSDDPSQRTDERVVEVVVSADGSSYLIGQRVLVKFMNPGQRAGVERPRIEGVTPDRAMRPAGGAG